MTSWTDTCDCGGQFSFKLHSHHITLGRIFPNLHRTQNNHRAKLRFADGADGVTYGYVGSSTWWLLSHGTKSWWLRQGTGVEQNPTRCDSAFVWLIRISCSPGSPQTPAYWDYRYYATTLLYWRVNPGLPACRATSTDWATSPDPLPVFFFFFQKATFLFLCMCLYMYI